MSKQFKCKRCGRCCMHMHSDDTGMPCEHLLVKNGKATCLIHNKKPEVCRRYPAHPDFGGEPCFFEIELSLKNDDLKAKNERLREYVRHKDDCELVMFKAAALINGRKPKCDCGLEQALKD